MGRSAKVLAPGEVRRLQAHAGRGRQGLRNRTMILLSFKAGLRACEIAGLDWSMVLMPGGRVGSLLVIADTIAKNGLGRRLPAHPDVKALLVTLHAEQGKPSRGAIIRSQRGGNMTARGIVNWFGRVYGEVGLDGCSSHSGRRTFITRTARLVAKAGGSLRDVQILVGHRDLATTQLYIDGDSDAQRKLVHML